MSTRRGGTLAAPEMIMRSSPPRNWGPYIFTRPLRMSQMPGTITSRVGLMAGSLPMVAFMSSAVKSRLPV